MYTLRDAERERLTETRRDTEFLNEASAKFSATLKRKDWSAMQI